MNFQDVVGDFSSIKKEYNGGYECDCKGRNKQNNNKKWELSTKTIDSPLFFYIFLCTIDIYIIFREDEEDAPSQIVHLIGNLPHKDAQAYQHLSPFVLQQ